MTISVWKTKWVVVSTSRRNCSCTDQNIIESRSLNELRAWAKSKLNFEPSDLHRRCSAGFLRVKLNNLDCELMQISAIYFPTFFQKADCTTFALSVCQSVGLSVSVTINFPSPNCVTQPHTDQVPPSTIQYYPLLTQCHQVPTISIFFTTATTTTTNNKQRQTTSNEKQMHMQMIIRRGRPLANDHPEGPASCK